MPIIQAPGGTGFEVLIETLLNKQRLEQSEQEFALRKKDFNLRQEEAEAARVRAQEEQQRQRDFLTGVQAAAQAFTSGAPTSEVAPTLPTAVLPSFLESLMGLQQTEAGVRSAGAGATSAEVGARVDVATEAEEIARRGAAATTAEATSRSANVAANVAEATEGAQIEAARASLSDVNIRNEINARVLRGSDPANGARAFSIWSGGEVTWDQAAEIAGFTGETSLPGDSKMAVGGEARSSADAVKAQGFLPLLRDSHVRIQQLGAGDFDGDGIPEGRPVRMTILGSLQQAAGNNTLDVAINLITDREQQALIQANRNFADAYRFSLSGQQSSDAERVAMMRSITETAGDDPATVAQKARIREAMIRVTAARAAGTMTALAAAQAGVQVVNGLGDSEITAAFQGRVDDVIEDMEDAAEGRPTISDIPGENTFGDVPGIVDSALGRGN